MPSETVLGVGYNLDPLLAASASKPLHLEMVNKFSALVNTLIEENPVPFKYFEGNT